MEGIELALPTPGDSADAALQRFLLGWCDGSRVEVDDVALTGLIERLDRAVLTDWEATSLAVRALTRAVAAAGRALVQCCGYGADHPVARTLAAAERFNALPSEAAYDAYVAAATMSYPYGAGDGCHRMPTFDSCEPGSGCTSGAGSLAQAAMMAGVGAVAAAVRRELRDWLPSAGAPRS